MKRFVFFNSQETYYILPMLDKFHFPSGFFRVIIWILNRNGLSL